MTQIKVLLIIYLEVKFNWADAFFSCFPIMNSHFRPLLIFGQSVLLPSKTTVTNFGSFLGFRGKSKLAFGSFLSPEPV